MSYIIVLSEGAGGSVLLLPSVSPGQNCKWHLIYSDTRNSGSVKVVL